MQQTEPWLSVTGIAQHLGVSKETIYRWIAREKNSAHRISKLWKFKPTEVDEWVMAGGSSNISLADMGNELVKLK